MKSHALDTLVISLYLVRDNSWVAMLWLCKVIEMSNVKGFVLQYDFYCLFRIVYGGNYDLDFYFQSFCIYRNFMVWKF